MYHYRARYYHVLLGRFISRDPAGPDSHFNEYSYVENRPTRSGDPSGLGIDSISQAVKGCLELPTYAAQMQCLNNLVDTGNPAMQKVVDVAKCEATHSAYKALKCQGCDCNTTKRQAMINASCLGGEVLLRKRYIQMKCDYKLPGSIKRGSKAAEAGHKAEIMQKGIAIGRCWNRCNSLPDPAPEPTK